MVDRELYIYIITKKLPTDYLHDSMRNHVCTKGVSSFHHPNPQVILSIAKGRGNKIQCVSWFDAVWKI